jgi:hypothetical protein
MKTNILRYVIRARNFVNLGQWQIQIEFAYPVLVYVFIGFAIALGAFNLFCFLIGPYGYNSKPLPY